jgi:hypothetical protein
MSRSAQRMAVFSRHTARENPTYQQKLAEELADKEGTTVIAFTEREQLWSDIKKATKQLTLEERPEVFIQLDPALVEDIMANRVIEPDISAHLRIVAVRADEEGDIVFTVTDIPRIDNDYFHE